jgi:hypothetical protein
VPHDVTASTGLSDRAFRAWVALQKWTWRGQQPTNLQLAQACGGWSLSKAKRALAELEAAGLIARVVGIHDGRTVRERIDLRGALPSPDAPGVTRPQAGNDPSPRPDPTRPGGSNLTPSERSWSKIGQDPQEEIVPTTTIPEQTEAIVQPRERISQTIPPLAPSPGLTEGQATFLAGLGPDERARFDALAEKTRMHLLRGFRFGADPVAQREASRILAPPKPRTPLASADDPPATILAALVSGDHGADLAFAGRLAREFGDHKSFKYYVSRAREVLTGDRAIGSLESAYRQACGPKAKDPGKVFTHALKTWDHQNPSGK